MEISFEHKTERNVHRPESEPVPTEKTFAQVVQDFMNLHVSPLAPSTIVHYQHMQKRPLCYFGETKFSTIKAIDIERFMVELRQEISTKGTPLAPKTIKHIFTFLHALFTFAEKYDYIASNPMVKVSTPTVPTKKIVFLDEQAAKKFLSELETAPLRWRAIMTLLLLTGLRRGEAAGLQWADIDFKYGTLRVERNVTYTARTGIVVSTPKTQSSVRKVPATPSLLAILKKWQFEQERNYEHRLPATAYVFAVPENPLSPPLPDTITRWLSRFVKERGLPNVSPHDLRHSCASLLLMSGATLKDTQEFMGHSDPATTMKYYTGTTDERLKRAGNALADALDF